ncbi:conserved hypothetical protein [methanotrophic bacterial endosymbiont of Bathymodiolus sp.]|nr:conserved hypothetical protein [methanotrophic bacterial endosymbiont of Bathymodiolus sp.]
MGKTKAQAWWDLRRRKHPHGRGEDKPLVVIAISRIETPPRAWGRLALGIGLTFEEGNTPTGVGKTNQQSRQTYKRKKHPHGRGEDLTLTSTKSTTTETPPRAWGRQ